MRVEVSTGEVLDKISILEIKLHNVKDEDKLKNIKREHHTLIKQLIEEGLVEMLTDDAYSDLLAINLTLWNTEDCIRRKEHLQEFDEEFVELARSVYIINDERARIKREINDKTGSLLIEEKDYARYTEERSDDGRVEEQVQGEADKQSEPNGEGCAVDDSSSNVSYVDMDPVDEIDDE